MSRLNWVAGSVSGKTNHQLSEISSFEQADKGLNRVLETIHHIFAEFDPAGPHPLGHLRAELMVALAVGIKDNEALYLDAPGQYGGLQQAGTVGALRQSAAVVLGNQTTQRHSGMYIQQRQHGVKDSAADIFEVNVDAVGTGARQ